MINLASALTNDTSAIQADVSNIYAFEKNISQVISLSSFLIFNNIYLIQYYWDDEEQKNRDNETIRTTIGNLSHSFMSNVSPPLNFLK
jgi:hypothetical protein